LEHQCFELHAQPYDVLLGRLGVEALQQRGIDWAAQPTAPGPAAGCMYFAQTRHNVCDQQPGVGFLTEWTTHGLEFDVRAGQAMPRVWRCSVCQLPSPISTPTIRARLSRRSGSSARFE
jgi:hypothetical protein